MKKEVTIYTLAEELNVSVASISRAFKPDSVLSDEKRKMILDAAERYGYVPDASASRLSKNVLNIGVLIYEYMKVYDDEIVAGIEKAYEELRGFKVNCDIRRFVDGRHPIKEVISVLDEFAAKKYDGILISKLPSKYLKTKIDELSDRGIKIVIFDSDIPDSKRLFVSMKNTDVAGRIVAGLFKMSLPENHRKIALFKSIDQDQLINAFMKYSDSEGLNVVDTITVSARNSEEDDKAYRSSIQKLFKKNADIDGIYISMANCIPVCKYLDSKGLSSKVRLITSDIFDDMLPYLDNGIIDASIYQDPFSQGYEAMKNLYYHLSEQQAVEEQLLIRPQIILKGNAALYL